MELKRAAKFFAQKFACGSTVSKDASGKDEIVIQGEFADKIVVIIGKEYPQVFASLFYSLPDLQIHL